MKVHIIVQRISHAALLMIRKLLGINISWRRFKISRDARFCTTQSVTTAPKYLVESLRGTIERRIEKTVSEKSDKQTKAWMKIRPYASGASSRYSDKRVGKERSDLFAKVDLGV